MTEELDRDRPLFNDAVTVQVKFPDHDKTLALTVRVLQGLRVVPVGSGGGQREGVLHIEITDELDPFFLYTLQVGEDDYHQLKHDQCLRVDFKSFPRKFIELLENCRGTAALTPEPRARGEASHSQSSNPGDPTFLARLETLAPGGFSVFSLVETNPFKELTHLSLKFRAGNDAAIKTYLAARLRQLKAEVSLTSSTLDDTRTILATEAAARSQVESEVSALRFDRERDLRDLRAAHSAELTAAREDGVRRAEEAAADKALELSTLRRKAEADLAENSQRLRQSEQRREELTDLKFAHEAELRELRGRNEAGEAGREAASSDARALREANRTLEARAFEAEREAERLRMQSDALTQQLADAKAMVEKSQALQEAAGASVARLEETQEAYKGSVVALQERLEASVNEINRGNAIIQKLQGQYRALRSKAKLKSEVIKQQERLLAEHEASTSATDSKLKAAAAERRAADARANGLQRELAASEGRVEESARLLASNEKVIKWLNKELNDAQMLPGGTTTAAVAAMAGAGSAFGAVPSPGAVRESFAEYKFGGGHASATTDRVDGVVGGGRAGDSKNVMFTAGIRESLGGGVSWDLRGTTLDRDPEGDDHYSYGREGDQGRGAESTPRRGNDYGASATSGARGRGAYSHVVTPESAGAIDPAQTSASYLERKGGAHEDDGDDGFGDRLRGGAIRGIPAF